MRTSPWPARVLGALLIAAAIGAYLLVGPPSSTSAAQQRVVKAQRGVVQSTVSATGSVTTPQSVGLSFQTGGKLVSLQVQPGDHVHSGEVLAEVDPTNALQAVQSAEINLRSAEAKQRQTEEVLSPQQAAANRLAVRQNQDAVHTAERSLREARASAGQDAASQALALSQAHTALLGAQQAAALDARGLQDAVNAAKAQLASDQAQSHTDPTKLSNDANAITGAENNQASATLKDQQSVTQAGNAVANAEATQRAGKLKDDQSIAQAESALTNAKDAVQSMIAANAVKSAAPLPGVLEGARTGVQSAQLSLNSARLTLAQAKLIAPLDGVVSTVSGAVGEQVSGGSGGSGGSSSASGGSSSGGSGGGSGGSGSGSSSSSGSGSSSAGSSGSGSGSSFITLTGLQGLQVTAGFSEADAAKLRVGQSANITVNALPGQVLAAHVISIPPVGTTSSGVVTFSVMLQLDQSVSGLRPGMSVSAQVVVAQVENAVNLPLSAVGRGAGGRTVTVMRAGKQVQVPVVLGMSGDNSVQILSGLKGVRTLS